ncbi:MAG: hypothetical protein JJV93_00245 [Alphaproteobacteria bacterium]|nr:hypothetical protein [Alphaproteobacteria bacterium]MBL0717686.1 hypothetical protein [Alphaproteobacteria bacterium]
MKTGIPFYEVVNKIFIGILFIIGLSLINIKVDLNRLDQFSGVNLNIIYLSFSYFIGTVISRLGSLVLENCFKSIKIIPWRDHTLFNKALNTNPRLELLSREYGFSRNINTLFIILFLVTMFKGMFSMSLIFLAFIILFTFSIRKHAIKIVKIIDIN